MARSLDRIPHRRARLGRKALAVVTVAALAAAMPGTGMAVVSAMGSAPSFSFDSIGSFTPATVDPQLARRVAASIGESGFGFTPGSVVGTKTRTVTVAVRVDQETARIISARTAAKPALAAAAGTGSNITLAPMRYNLGIARGYQGFAAKAPKASVALRTIDMPDLAEFAPSTAAAPAKPSRFQARIQLDKDSPAGRAPRTFEAGGEQSVDVGGAYRLSRNLDVTAGVRLSQERDRLAPLTDTVQDSQAVYVGTQLRF